MINIVTYVITSIIACIFGQVVSHLNKKLPPVVSEEITYKEFFESLSRDFKIDIKYSLGFLILFNLFIYFIGNNVNSYLYMIISFSLAIVFYIDFKYELIPDECHAIILVAGIINFIINILHWWNYLLGAVIGAGIFWLLGKLALLIFKKDGMGFGDVKLMGALGFFFGIKYTLIITLISFFLGAIVGGVLLILKKKGADSYIPFGPFIVIATVILMFINADDIIYLYIAFCSMLGEKISDLIFLVLNKNS